MTDDMSALNKDGNHQAEMNHSRSPGTHRWQQAPWTCGELAVFDARARAVPGAAAAFESAFEVE